MSLQREVQVAQTCGIRSSFWCSTVHNSLILLAFTGFLVKSAYFCLDARSCCLLCTGWICLLPLFAAVVDAWAQSQLVPIAASMCHRDCCRLAHIKAANRWSCSGAASEFSAPLPSVIGHTHQRTKRAEGCTGGKREWEAKDKRWKNKD